MTLPEASPEAVVQTGRYPFQLIWLVPLVAGLIAAFLGWHALSQRGPTITIAWRTGEGLQAGQTKVRHKAVELGTVRRVELSNDMSNVIATVEMQRQATRFLTGNTRFWVVRPRLASGDISGLETLVSGSFIELDPGSPDGVAERSFTGLEEPPAVRSDEPGQTFRLTTDRIGSLASGSPVFYRDIDAGEVLNVALGPDGRQLGLQVFIRSPYDRFVHAESHFWNASGVAVDLGANGVQLRLESLRAVLSGGIAFDTGDEASLPPAGASFPLYRDEASARAAGYKERLPVVIYVEGSVRGLAAGAPVEFYGIQVGTVTDVQLELDQPAGTARVAVRMEIQPQRVSQEPRTEPPLTVIGALVRRGLRAQLRTANFLTGQLLVALDFFPDAAPAEATQGEDAIVLPSLPGGLDSLTAGLGDIVQKLNRLPLEQVAKNLNDTLAGTSAVANGPELHAALRALAAAMASAQAAMHELDAGLTPVLRRLPEIAQTLQTTLDHTSRLAGSADAAYGQSSQVRRDLERLLEQVNDAARSVRLLADTLNQHPEALLRGRSGRAGD